jgi:hypothetical protein
MYSLFHDASSIPTIETISWLVHIGTALIATLPTPTRIPTIIDFSGTIFVALLATASSVMSLTASFLPRNFPLSAVVPIQGIEPLKNSGCLLEGVPPL